MLDIVMDGLPYSPAIAESFVITGYKTITKKRKIKS